MLLTWIILVGWSCFRHLGVGVCGGGVGSILLLPIVQAWVDGYVIVFGLAGLAGPFFVAGPVAFLPHGFECCCLRVSENYVDSVS